MSSSHQTPGDSGANTPSGLAAALGEDALAQILSGTPDGVVVRDESGRLTYANPAAHRLGVDRTGSTVGPSTGPDRGDHEVVRFDFGAEATAPSHTVSVFRDLTEPRVAVRKAAALAQTVAQVAGSVATNEVLAGIARHAVEQTRAVSAGISVLSDDQHLGIGGSYGPGGPSFRGDSAAWEALNSAPGRDVLEAMTAGAITVDGAPGKAVVLADARSMWEASPIMTGFARAMSPSDWRGAICVPLAWGNQVIGVLGVYLPRTVAGPTEAELAFCTALADQAAIAVSTARLSAEARRAAALEERSRLARELHDSVSQSLFSIAMHARAAELALVKADVDDAVPLRRSIRELEELARVVLAEMRALIFALRPVPLAEEGLVGALTKLVAVLTAREDLPITFDDPGQSVDLSPEVEEHVYRIVAEALHNVVKHARATAAAVTVTLSPGFVRVVVSDDGVGFDPASTFAGHLGLTTMTQRAADIGAEITFTSRVPGADSAGPSGTAVTLTVPTRSVDEAGG